VVQRLLAARAPADASHALAAIRAGALALVAPLVARAGGVDRTALLVAVASQGFRSAEWAALARRWIALGADAKYADGAGVTAAHWAAYWTDLPMLEVLVRAGASLDVATTRPWVPEDEPKKKGLRPRDLIEASLTFERPTLASNAEQRASWESLATALGTTLDAWLDALDRPAPTRGQQGGKGKKKAASSKTAPDALDGAWRAVLVTEIGPDGVVEVGEEHGGFATLTLDRAGAFVLEGSDLLSSCEGQWERGEDGVLLRLYGDPYDRGTLAFSLATEGRKTQLVHRDAVDGSVLTWTFERDSAAAND
jgi:hypothetical protein